MNFKSLFYPKSIAVVGASRKEKTVGNDIVKNLVKQGFAGKIYPVNPKADRLYGLKVYADINEINEPVDLVVVAVPAIYTLQVIADYHKKGTEAFIIISAGYKEMGNVSLEEEIAHYCQDHQLALIGPNCLGVVNPEHRMNASFAVLMPKPGNIAFISQSGALCTTVLDYAKQLNLGFSKFVSIGNKAVVDELILLRYLKNDPQTKVIALYVEQLAAAPEFIKTIKEITSGENAKPVIILKSGKTAAGSAAVASHTGSLSGGSVAYDALFEQSGVIQANTISELFDYAAIFSENEIQDIKNVAIITNAGGPGVLTTDAVVTAGLDLAILSEKTQADLKKFLPPAASVKNPVDVLGDAVGERYEKTLNIVEADQGVDALILILTPQSMTEIEATAQAVVNLKKKSSKPIIVSFMGQETVKTGVKILETGGITTATFPESAGRALAAMNNFSRNSQVSFSKEKNLKSDRVKVSEANRKLVGEIFAKAKINKKNSFPEAQTLPILEAYGLPVLKSGQAKTAQEAVELAHKIGAKLAMKIISQDILHKSDVGGVMLNVTPKTVKADFAKMMRVVKANQPQAKIDGVLLMEMAAEGGIELILGVKKVMGLGTMILVGMGGIYVEILKDAQLGFVPLTTHDVERLISKLKMYPILKGARGQKGYDLQALKEALMRLNQLVIDFGEIVELDINPLMIFTKGQGVKALDGRLVLQGPTL